MGRKTILLDDLDGTELPDDAQPVQLSLGRTTYALYLTEKNHEKLLAAVAPFIENAETVSNSPARSAPRASDTDKTDQRNARAWAIETGFTYKSATGEERTLGDRGRIPDAVVQGWREAGAPVMG